MFNGSIPILPLSLKEVECTPATAAYVQQVLANEDPAAGIEYDLFTIKAGIAEEIKRFQSTKRPPSPAHLTQFILKNVTDCNLRCTYPCYEYVTDAWRKLPAVMSDEVIKITGERIGAYAAAVGLRQIGIGFHGGEPLYMHNPEAYYDRIIPLLLKHIKINAPETTVDLGMQTNATLLRTSILEVLKTHNVSVGVSIDGDAAAHDASRRTKNGQKGSHALAMRGLALLSLPEYASLARSILCVININADPYVTNDFLRRHAPPTIQYIDYLLPSATHDAPPKQPHNPHAIQPGNLSTPYASWLLAIHWHTRRDPDHPKIRLLDSITRLALGRSSNVESIGPQAGSEVIIRTDGAYECHDTLNVTAPNATHTNMNVATHDLHAVADLLRQKGHLGPKILPAVCHACPVVDMCGSGPLATRYSAERQLDNPSVYCADLKVLVSEIKRSTTASLYHGMAEILEAQGAPKAKIEGGCSTC